MPEMIRDGTGDGYLTGVDSEHRLKVSARLITWAANVNHDLAEAYLLYTDITPTATGDTFLYMKNTHEHDMIISSYRAYTPTAEAIDVYINRAGTPTGTTTITPVNMNLGSGKAARGDFYEGVDILSLSGGSLLDRIRIAGGSDILYSWTADIVVPQNHVLTFQALTGAVAIELTVAFYYRQI